ncbi:thiol-disulfide oxidoreductase DCC family protein [Shewanella sp. KCT]|uniref:thiol-disulfide oxidoreductase DCC family protein n=1 Tax=Shewanella sp. KCT TaxID=2569535 RepID=UPI001183ABAB|nr:DCC1-like thiol-disulfide oxidoreductase family protein [Shewanella sp. KCT]
MRSQRINNQLTDIEDRALQGDFYPLVIFDGSCNLCHGAVRFIVRRDRREHFKFASIQSETAQRLLANRGINVDLEDLSSFYLLDEQGVLAQSEAALAVASQLDGLWPLLRVLKVLPRGLRDWSYRQVANRRYRLFGRRACALPSKVDRGRFIE